MKKNWIIVAVLLSAGLLSALLVFFYPEISDQLSRYRQEKIITEYDAEAAAFSDEQVSRMLEEAERCNRELLKSAEVTELNDEEKKVYESILNTDGTGIMGYIDIPKIGVRLPVCHGTDEEAMQKTVGHLEGTSFPVGGTGTHAVISGHRGLPEAKLFTDIDQLEPGDRFRIHVPGRSLTYEVDQKTTVLPDEMEELRIDPERDYCTLVTCTPYGVNTHRLLVRGVRVEDDNTVKGPEKTKLNPLLLIPLFLAPALVILLLVLIFGTLKKRRQEDET